MTNSPDKIPSTPEEQKEDRPKFKLSLTELAVGATSAVVAAMLGSRLGVAGTLIGAATASVTVGIVSTSLKTAVEHVKRGPKWVAISVVTTAVVSLVIALALVTVKEVSTGQSLDGRSGAVTVARLAPSRSSEQTPEPEESQTPPAATNRPEPAPEPTVTPTEPVPEPQPTETARPVEPTPVGPDESEPTVEPTQVVTQRPNRNPAPTPSA